MNPYLVVGSPNYAAPLLNFSPLSGRPQQQQTTQNPGATQNPNTAYRLGNSIRNFGQGLFGYMNPQQSMPLNIAPGTVAGANSMLSGIY